MTDEVTGKVFRAQGPGDLFEANASQGYIFAGVSAKIEVFDEAKEVMAGFFAICDHLIDDEAEEGNRTTTFGKELVIFDDHFCVECCIH